jgi:Transglutaminase-like superfamily
MHVQKYRLSEHAFLCIARRYCVVLDARHDRYLAIKTDMMESLGPWLDGWVGPSVEAAENMSLDSSICDLASSLRRREILTSSSDAGKPVQPQIIPPAIKSTPTHLHAVRGTELMRHRFNFLRAVARTRHLFKTGSFNTIAHEIAATRERGSIMANADCDHEGYLVAIFSQCRPLYSRPLVCLFDCVCLLTFLAQYGFHPSIVFAVIPEPFQAHCWLQHDQSILNDSLEHTSAFAPIMRI